MASPPETKYATYWVTRERRSGKLADRVEVWLVRPERLRFDDGDVMWIAPRRLVDMGPTYYGEWSLEQALKNMGPGYPGTDRECVRVGEDDSPGD